MPAARQNGVKFVRLAFLALWDAGSRTMTEVTRYGDITQTTTSCFAEDSVEEWSTVNTEAADEVVSEMRGTNRRRA